MKSYYLLNCLFLLAGLLLSACGDTNTLGMEKVEVASRTANNTEPPLKPTLNPGDALTP